MPSADPDDLEPLRAELARLRADLRRLRWGVVLLGGLAAVTLAGGSRPAGVVLQAERIEVTGDGGARAVLQARRGVPELVMSDGAGGSLSLGVRDGAPTLTLVAADGTVETVGLAASAPPPEPVPVPEPEPVVPIDPATAVTVQVPPGLPYTGVEVRCTSGFRERAPISGGLGQVGGVPPGDGCRAHLLGGPPKSAPVRSGHGLICQAQGDVVVCDPQ